MVVNGVIWCVITTSEFLVIGHYKQIAAVGVVSNVSKNVKYKLDVTLHLISSL